MPTPPDLVRARPGARVAAVLLAGCLASCGRLAESPDTVPAATAGPVADEPPRRVRLTRELLAALEGGLSRLETAAGAEDPDPLLAEASAALREVEELPGAIARAPQLSPADERALRDEVDRSLDERRRRIKRLSSRLRGSTAPEERRLRFLECLLAADDLLGRAGYEVTEVRRVLVNPGRVLVTGAGDVAVAMTWWRYRAPENTPLHGGAGGWKLNPRHRLLEEKTRYLVADGATVRALVRHLVTYAESGTASDKRTRQRLDDLRGGLRRGRLMIENVPHPRTFPVAGGEHLPPWALVPADDAAPTAEPSDLPAAFREGAAEHRPDSVPYREDDLSLTLDFSKLVTWLPGQEREPAR